jgi:hypothetical protein
MTTYNYSISAAFPNNKVDCPRLEEEIAHSAITIALDSIDVSGDFCSLSFKAALTVDERTILAGIVTNHSGLPLPSKPAPTTSDGRPRVAMEKPDSTKYTLCSHDWTDKTTWYTESIKIVDEIASDSGNHTIYTLAHQNVIDTYHGLIWQEDFLKDVNGASYRVIVKVNNEVKTERDPHVGSGGDYTINYVDGTVTFGSPLLVDDEVKVTYNYANTSGFYITAPAGKKLTIDAVEAQFAADVTYTDTIVFQPYGYVDAFAPQLIPAVPSGTLIPLGDPLVYKTVTDIMADAVKCYPSYPVIGASNWRGTQTPTLVFDWDYVSSTTLNGNAGMRIRVSLQHDVPFGGWFSTTTFYCYLTDL